MKKRVITLVIDSLGVGLMDDYKNYREDDVGANTLGNIIKESEYINIETLEFLGIKELIGENRSNVKKNASCGKIKLKHIGADSFMGHQEIMGTIPKKPVMESFALLIDVVKSSLEKEGYQCKKVGIEKKVLQVNEYIFIADNIEADFGQIINITSALSYTSFEKVLEIAEIVRNATKVNRVIALGGEDVTPKEILNAIETTEDGREGINCPKSGVYKKNYRAKHIGYGVNYKNQVSSILVENNIDVTLIGKMADVIDGSKKIKFITAVETEKTMYEILKEMKTMDEGLICATVQETDLAGHKRDVNNYALKLTTVDMYLKKIIEKMEEKDILLITADHGNDPTIGHSYHTREKVPIIAYKKNGLNFDIGTRDTLSDIGNTICDYYNVEKCEGGTSFLKYI